MELTLKDWIAVAPEMTLLALACTVMLVDLFLDKERSKTLTPLLFHGSILLTAVVTVVSHMPDTVIAFSGAYVSDGLSLLLKLVILLGISWVYVYARPYMLERGLLTGDFHSLGLFAVLGMMIMVSAAGFLSMYMGLELLSLCLYALVALDRDSERSTEAAMKYFVLGSIASAMLLYGISMIYGVTGQLGFAAIAQAVATIDSQYTMVLVLGVVFVVVGLAFKLGAAPFHMWVPDVYHGAPTAITLLISTVPKVAALGMALRILTDGLGGVFHQWQEMLVMLSVLSIVLGNVVAIAQTNLKRMFAYSAIAHAGFITLGMVSGTEAGYSGAVFYVIAYTLMTLGGFGMITYMSHNGYEAEHLNDLKGLNQRDPWMAFVMMVLVLSMAGIPLTVGFIAKVSVLVPLVQVGLTWLAVLAVLFAVVGAFYYLRVVKLMYFDEAERSGPLAGDPTVRWVLSLNGVLVLALGVFPAPLVMLCVGALSG